MGKMRDQGGVIIRQARRMIEEIGYDLKTGLHLEDAKGVKKEEISDDILMREIDNFLADENHESLPLEDVLRKLSMDKAGTSPGFKPKSDEGATPSTPTSNKKKKPRDVSPMAAL